MINHQYHPFDKSKKMNWNIWIPGVTSLSHLSMDGSWCLMLDRKTGNVYTKKAKNVDIMEWNQAAGHAAVMAVAHEKECF